MSELSDPLREYLRRCGLPEKKLAACTWETRLYHDLRIYGDVAEAYMGVLVDHYQVDLSGFEFDKFFPPEFAGRNMLTRVLLWIVPFAGKAARDQGEYRPLTMSMLDRVIRDKRWVPSE
ncbi:DUF1493 family protein [Aquabacterium sp. A7-Y]|uniref:DUF1493 family protein n=1 Tax=Aquabacterium sp. A7-Y TaxID=1349605 RepID=UPI00223DC84C|nr:DUF1493 family protein [Aquabacterium sp. A7-Y]MCW7536262.1 DUF1493 family protein [Aquabacterium sp. A7-Y]